jgi:hypothetical protein
MSLIATYSDIISPFIQTYREAKNEKGRKKVIVDAVDTVKKSKIILEDGKVLPENLHTVSI